MTRIVVIALIVICTCLLLKISKGQTVSNCEEILKYYTYVVGLNVYDCDDKTPSGNIFWRIDQRLPWDSAREGCRSVQGGEFASIHNFQELKTAIMMFYSKPTGTSVWIGLRRFENGTYTWSDNSEFDYSNHLDWVWAEEPTGCYTGVLATYTGDNAAANDWGTVGSFYYAVSGSCNSTTVQNVALCKITLN